MALTEIVQGKFKKKGWGVWPVSSRLKIDVTKVCGRRQSQLVQIGIRDLSINLATLFYIGSPVADVGVMILVQMNQSLV